jgi:ribosomal protein L19E
MKAEVKGQACLAAEIVKLGSFRISWRPIRRASSRAPVRAAAATAILSAQKDPGEASKPLCTRCFRSDPEEGAQSAGRLRGRSEGRREVQRVGQG